MSEETSVERAENKSDASSTEDCSMDLHETVREIRKSDDVCTDSRDDVIDVIPNQNGASTPQEASEANLVQLNVIVIHVPSSTKVGESLDSNLAETFTQHLQWRPSVIACPDELGKMRYAWRPSVPKR